MKALQALVDRGATREQAWQVIQELAQAEDALKEMGIPPRDTTLHNYKRMTVQIYGRLSELHSEMYLAEFEEAV